ncbi:SE-cephalotoxin-like [Sander lucioperca]|uniref:SE-cephalotoxin-like n=1 Tax=Sander lucioperca TaxID=283035 RepID=A0A8C9YIH3_SANLU|nr:SE-cephalotoxin-like [Sander lucioperca]XP_031162822.1 SE-cephalotoxin-like [Sander lucioperca]
MAFPRLSASMLLASLILLLYWTKFSAQSHDPTSSIVSPSYRVKRDLDFETREKVDKSLALASSFLTIVKEGIEKIDTKKLSAVMKSLANVASLAPGVGVLVASFVNMVLILIPQDDPVLNEVKKGFAEVNRKLDLLSIQISNLATDVEWFNYASVYSQDEVRILNSWKKFDELLQNTYSVQSEEDKLRLAEIFVNYYENTGTEASVANLYHYLTVKDTSLSGNLNELLRKKFKCDVQEIGKYNIYFSSLLWKGIVLNQVYWKLIGLDILGIKTKHTQMFNNVYAAQKSALEYCLDNHMQYVKEDVKEISKGLSADNKQAIADKVKEFLDKKYNWYNWVVLVYCTEQEEHYELNELAKVTVDTITIAVGYTLIAVALYDNYVIQAAARCFETYQPCDIKDKTNKCVYFPPKPNPYADQMKLIFKDYAKATHAAYGNKFAEAPAPLCHRYCEPRTWYPRKISIYYSRRLPVCQGETCSNHGTCKQLMDSNEWMCDCWEGYHGERCEERTQIISTIAIDLQVVPDISTIDTKIKLMTDKLENKLEEILKFINDTCRG